jgi:lipopolysaccharide export LptBFGC system permease protein LptF
MIAGELFQVVRRQQFVGANGQISTQTKTYNARGSIGPAGASFLNRLADQQFQGKALSVVTVFRLRGASKESQGYSYQPDLVKWKDNFYIVQEVTDYSQYGAGMTQANCVTFDYVDFAPDANTTANVKADFTQPRTSDQITPIRQTD